VSQQRTGLEAALLARKTKQIELLARVKVFLDAISRNSIKSKRSYSSIHIEKARQENRIDRRKRRRRRRTANYQWSILTFIS
jgi:hypothetical protein